MRARSLARSLRYYTGILEMGEFNGPVEAQLFAMLTCFFTAGACTLAFPSLFPFLFPF